MLRAELRATAVQQTIVDVCRILHICAFHIIDVVS